MAINAKTTNKVHTLYPVVDSEKIPQYSLNHLSIPYNNGYKILEMDKILFLESSSNYTNIYFTDGSKNLCSKTLKYFEDKLPPERFIRPHRSFIVPVNRVEFISLNPFALKIKDHQIPVSRNKTQEIKELFGI